MLTSRFAEFEWQEQLNETSVEVQGSSGLQGQV